MTDPFAIFDLPRRFDLDAGQLHQRFIALTATAHPDRFTDPLRQAEAMERTAEINEAYALLNDPEQRANVLLQLLGGPAKESDKSLPPDLLMQMMAVREQMELAVANDDRPALDRLQQWAAEQRHAHLQTLHDMFSQAGEPIAPDLARRIRTELNAMRYIQRMLDQMPMA